MLILLLGFISNEVSAAGVSNHELTTKFISTIQDNKIQGQIQESAEFSKCREEAKKAKNASPESIAEKAANCIKVHLKDPEKAKQLAENLRLVEFGLTPSKNLRDVTDYIANKMYKSLTGIDRNDPVAAFMEKTKFKNAKQVDQADFFLMHKSQLAKSALFQISAFCFNDLRIKGSQATTFKDHWVDVLEGKKHLRFEDLKADGVPEFAVNADETDKTKIYKNLEESIGGGNYDSEAITKFHKLCTDSILPLCKDGAGRACALQKNLQAIRKAFNEGEKAWAEYSKSGTKTQLTEIGKYEIYDSFKAKKEDSIDSLTTMSSNDFLHSYEKDKQLDDCIKKPDEAKCEAYITEGKTTYDAVTNSNINMAFNTEIEKSKVADLAKKNDSAGLQDYLQANGYLEIIERMKLDKSDPNHLEIANVAEEVGLIYEARRRATIDAVSKKMGSRQVEETDQMKKDAQVATAKDYKQERVRLAQVVLFNNIITSQLKLEKKVGNGKTEEVGRNTSGLDKELSELQANSVDTEVFKGLKGDTGRGTASSASGNTNIAEIGFLDGYLGKKEETSKNPKSP